MATMWTASGIAALRQRLADDSNAGFLHADDTYRYVPGQICQQALMVGNAGIDDQERFTAWALLQGFAGTGVGSGCMVAIRRLDVCALPCIETIRHGNGTRSVKQKAGLQCQRHRS